MSGRRRTRRLGLAAAAAAAASTAQAATSDVSVADSTLFWVRWAGALGLCLLLALAGAYAMKVRQSGAPVRLSLAFPRWAQPLGGLAARRLRLIESLRISPQLEVSLVECDDRELLLATTSHGAVLLREGPKTVP